MRLHTILNRGLDIHRRLLLVSAPAGYGKTTVVSEWLSEQNHPHVWISLDTTDNDPMCFFTYLIAALQKIQDQVGRGVKSLLSAPQLPPVSMLIASLLNELVEITAPFIIVMDDFHMIHNPYLYDGVQYLLEYAPSCMKVLIISREDPPLMLSKMRVRGQMVEIRVHDLRFNLQETIDFYQYTMQLALQEEAAAVLEQRTEGWIAGLQLAGISLQGSDQDRLRQFVEAFSGSQRYVLDYLLEEVLQRQDEEMRQFLCKTSILKRFNASLCNAVTDREDGQKIIEYLDKANLFLVSLDEKREWYRYHHLFADILLLEMDVQVQNKVHEKAAIWLGKYGYDAEAISHAFVAHNMELAEQLIERNVIRMLSKGEVVTLLDWLNKLSDQRIRENAQLAIGKIHCLILREHLDETIHFVEELQRDESIKQNKKLLGVLLYIQAFIAVMRKDLKAVTLAEDSIQIIKAEDPILFIHALFSLGQAQVLAGNISEGVNIFRQVYVSSQKYKMDFLTLAAVTNMSLQLIILGKRKEAIYVCEESRRIYLDQWGRLLPIARCIYVPLGMAYYVNNDLDKAYQYLIEGVENNRSYGMATLIGDGEWAMAMIQYAKGDVQVALETLKEAYSIVEKAGIQSQMDLFSAQIAEFEAKQGNMQAALHWIKNCNIFIDDIKILHHDRCYMAYIRVLMMQGQVEQAQHLLSKLEEKSLERQRIASLISIYILQAVVHDTLGCEKEAVDYLKKAIYLAAEEGYIRQFLQDGKPIVKFLTHSRKIAPDFIDQFLHLFSMEQDQGGKKKHLQKSPTDGLIEQLSERELEIVQLIAQGHSNKEIAFKLFITIGTTKWHINNIFGKLGVKNRVQAVERARDLNLWQG